MNDNSDIPEFCTNVKNATDDELNQLLHSTYETEWAWNRVADELNRRRANKRKETK